MSKRVLHLHDRFDFGKYKGMTVDSICRSDPSYIRWVRDNVNRVQISDAAWKLAVSTGIADAEHRADNFGTAGDWGFPEF